MTPLDVFRLCFMTSHNYALFCKSLTCTHFTMLKGVYRLIQLLGCVCGGVLCVRSAAPHRALLVWISNPANHLPTWNYSALGLYNVHVDSHSRYNLAGGQSDLSMWIYVLDCTRRADVSWDGGDSVPEGIPKLLIWWVDWSPAAVGGCVS